MVAPPPELPFPRGKAPPVQSPRFWVHHKDRYLRQLLIRDIEEQTGRDPISYFTDCDTTIAQIDKNDDAYLVELLGDRRRQGVDLLLETNGGWTDATEKVVSILRKLAGTYRVIVPRRAKSNGTVIALAASTIVMGENSELGPIDPNVNLAPGTSVPAYYIIQLQPNQVDPLVRMTAESAMNQTRKLALTVLKEGMLKEMRDEELNALVEKISSRGHYHSHGSVIDHAEAAALGLAVDYLNERDDLWRRIWLLRTMYEFDCKEHKLSKIFEGARVSSSISLPPPAPQKP